MGRLARRIRAHWRKRHRKREALRTSREFFKRQHTLRRWRLPKQNSSDITPFTGAPSSRTTPAPPKHGLLDSLLPSRKTTDARSTHTGTARRGALTVEASAPGASTHQPRLLDARTYENLRDFIDAKVLSSPARTAISTFLLVIVFFTLMLLLPIASNDGQMAPLHHAFFTATSAVASPPSQPPNSGRCSGRSLSCAPARSVAWEPLPSPRCWPWQPGGKWGCGPSSSPKKNSILGG